MWVLLQPHMSQGKKDFIVVAQKEKFLRFFFNIMIFLIFIISLSYYLNQTVCLYPDQNLKESKQKYLTYVYTRLNDLGCCSCQMALID